MILEWLAVFFMIAGTFFMVTGSIGLVRMPDIYCRMHAMSKCVTLGVSGILFAAVFQLHTWDVAIKVVLAIAFQFITTPVSTHMIARAAYYHLGIGFWKNTFVEEWKGWRDVPNADQ